MYRTTDIAKVATIPVGKLPHGLWPSGDGARVYVGLENDDSIVATDTATNRVVAPTSVTLFDQGLLQVLEASVTGLWSQGNNTFWPWHSVRTAAVRMTCLPAS